MKDYALEYGSDLTGNIFIITSNTTYIDYIDYSSSEGYLVKLFSTIID
jgi:hypothetical protein